MKSFPNYGVLARWVEGAPAPACTMYASGLGICGKNPNLPGHVQRMQQS